MKQPIRTERAPAAIGPYSQAIKAGGFIFVSGQLPIDPELAKLCDEGGIERYSSDVLTSLVQNLAPALSQLAS